MNTPRKVVLATTVFGVAFTGALAKSAYGLTTTSDATQSNSIKLPLAGPNRPQNVPDGYVITPFGYFHPSCVQSLAKGERQMPDGRLQHANGSVEQKAAVCNFPHYTRSGVSSSEPRAKSPEINGWLENANFAAPYADESFGALIATWIVPPSPRANDGQVLYFFPGLEDLQDYQTSILQPVLGWYWGQWTIASWNCCINGVITNSPFVVVNPGDIIYGSITNTCNPGTLSCPTWNVLSVDLSTGDSTILSNTPSEGQTFDWAFEGVLEAYSVVACNDFPPDRRLAFRNVVLFDQDLNPVVRPEWSDAVDNTANPWCGYNVHSSTHDVTLHY